MQCEEIRQQFADYVNGSLAPAALEAFEAHEARCSACRAEIAELRSLWNAMGRMPERAMDTAAMDERFDAMIADFKKGMDPAEAPGFWARLQALMIPLGGWRLAAAMGAILLVAAVAFLTVRKAPVQNVQTTVKPPEIEKHVDNDPPVPPTPAPTGTAPKSTIPTDNGAKPDQMAVIISEDVNKATMKKIALRLDAPVDLGGDERYLTHVSTDKPIYRPGERLFMRGVLLRADSHAPMPPSGSTATIEIKGPKGESVASGVSTIVDSTVGFNWSIPEGQAAGLYTIRVTHPSTGFAPAERKFDIRTYRPPRLKTQIVFARDGYGPGDTVTASLHVDRAEGGVPSGASVAIAARVDGSEVWSGTTTVDASGNASARFPLPAEIERGEGVLAMTINDGAVETAAKTIPIVLRTVDLAIYPEGGDLVAGLANRVYIEGRNINQKPADVAGIVVNGAGRQVGTFRTEHEGRGRFTFTPVRGETYSLRITAPSGIKTTFPLPEVRTSGVVLTTTSNVIPKQQDVVLRVAASTSGVYGIAVSQRGKEIAFTRVSLQARTPVDVTLSVPRSLDGVIAATVYDNRFNPVAERLLFRQPEHRLKVAVTADRTDYVPGDKVTLRVATTDETGRPVGAVVGLGVTDSSVLEMIEKREQAPSLPVMALVENDVRNLADAHIYLDQANPAKAALATDLLLGTQGWRRFATVDLTTFVTAHGDAARRALAIRKAPPAPVVRNALNEAPVRWNNWGPGNLVGRVLDQTNYQPLPGVTVKVTNQDTGSAQSMLTNDSGVYSFLLQPGANYSVSTEMRGFKKKEITGLPAGTANTQRLDVILEAGDPAQTVTLEAKNISPLLKDPTVGITLGETEILNLPTLGGDPLQLIATLPGYRANPLGHEYDTVGGLPMSMINTVRDGLSVTDGFNPGGVGSTTILNSDMIQEIRLILAPVDAEAGRGNGQVLITTRVREYAHTLSADWKEGSRRDFIETLYWHTGLKTDAQTGLATVSFTLSDAITSFKVLADAFTANGALGSGAASIESVRPFFVEPKVPLQVTSGDIVRLPISFVNGVSRNLGPVTLNVSGASGLKINSGEGFAALSAKERTRRMTEVEIGRDYNGVADLRFEAAAGAYRDTVVRKLDVQPLGFPYELSSGGTLAPGRPNTFEFTLPEETLQGSVSSNVVVYTTPLASMTQALAALLREPNGCFEQTSSTSYPMVMAQQYFLTHTGVAPSIIDRAKGFLDTSYKRLIGFEARSGGYEWYGGDPGHEALTAYGLMQFTDMAQVRDVDANMIQRTRAWLLGRRDGKGGFIWDSRQHGAIGSAPADTADAYITWALLESGEKGLGREIAHVKALANSTEDSYIIALGANVLHLGGDHAGARQLLDRLAKAQIISGNVVGSSTSITRSYGDSLSIETTALSILAWLREPGYAENVEKGMTWLAGSNRNGRFGATQSTIMALRAIVAYDAANARPKAAGRIVLTIDGKPVGAPVNFTPETQGAITIPDFGAELGPGRHTAVLQMEDGSSMPFSFSIRYSSPRPGNAREAKIGIQVTLKDQQIREGGVTEAMASITNKTDQVIPTPIAIVGIPGGLEVRHDQLKELVKSGKIAAYEVVGREVILYWRYLKANEKVDVPLSLIAAIPGVYTGPASRAYLYYTDEYKNWATGLKVTITAR